MKNYYAILEVPVGCDLEEIRGAYRRLVQENLANGEAYAELKEAYEVLTTPARRTEYDKAIWGEAAPSSAALSNGTEAAGQEAVLAGQAEGLPAFVASHDAGRRCPLAAGLQCPVINTRVPLSETFCPECGVLLASLPPEGLEPVAAPDANRQIRFEELNGQAHRLKPGLNMVGREGTDVLLPDKTVSRQHARVEVGENNVVTLEDLSSTNGTHVNGEQLPPHMPRELADSDLVRFGSVQVRLCLPPQDFANESSEGEEGGERPPLNWDEVAASMNTARARLVGGQAGGTGSVPLVPGVTTMGRRAENSIVLRDDPYISGSHAQIIAEGDVFRLTDLGSTNGTLLNGERVRPNEPVGLSPGDQIALGATTYRFERIEPVPSMDGETPETSTEGETETVAEPASEDPTVEAPPPTPEAGE